MKRKKILISGIALLVAALMVGLGAQALRAESNVGVGGAPATAQLNFQVTLNQLLLLQIGSPGATINTVSCTVSTIPGTGSVPMISDGTNPVPTRVSAVVPAGATVTLTVNSVIAPLTSGPNTIPFSQISCSANGDGFTSYSFNDTASQQLNQWTGSGNRLGDYTFSYKNENYYPTGTYNGHVIYTLSSP